jgi:hypothetical protein
LNILGAYLLSSNIKPPQPKGVKAWWFASELDLKTKTPAGAGVV